MLSKQQARTFFLGGTVLSFLVFLGLSWHTLSEEVPKKTNEENLTEAVIRGKVIWEENNCIGCHTLLGEGAYFAPELGNVYTRFGESTDAIKAFIKYRPVEGIEDRRSMPRFNLTEEELAPLSNLVEQYLIFAQGQAMRRISMHMNDWIKKLDSFLTINDRDILNHAGKISHDMAKQLAEAQYETFNQNRISSSKGELSDFDVAVKKLESGMNKTSEDSKGSNQ